MNVEDVGHMNEQQQDTLLTQLRQDGVRTIRTGMLNHGMLDPQFARFVTGAFKHGIATVLIIYPTQGGTGRHTAPANPSMGRKWPVPALSDLDPERFGKWLGPQFATIEAAGLRLSAIELGNEFNKAGYNADFLVPGSGRVLGIFDLNNSHDSEASSVAAGYRAYLKVLTELKDMRDHSDVNGATPILLGGLAKRRAGRCHFGAEI